MSWVFSLTIPAFLFVLMLVFSVWRWLVVEFALTSCGARQLLLTPSEEVQLQTLSAHLGSTVSLQYDYAAVTHHRLDGVAALLVDRTAETAREVPFCSLDSLALQQQAAATAAALVPQLRFRQYHNRLIIIYQATMNARNGSASGLVVASLRKNVWSFATVKTVFNRN